MAQLLTPTLPAYRAQGQAAVRQKAAPLRKKLERAKGSEPSTYSLGSWPRSLKSLLFSACCCNLVATLSPRKILDILHGLDGIPRGEPKQFLEDNDISRKPLGV
jgi:hypothetical protein